MPFPSFRANLVVQYNQAVNNVITGAKASLQIELVVIQSPGCHLKVSEREVAVTVVLMSVNQPEYSSFGMETMMILLYRLMHKV